MKLCFSLRRASGRFFTLFGAATLATGALITLPGEAANSNDARQPLNAAGIGTQTLQSAQTFYEVPGTADSLADMVGFEVHLHYTNSVYATNYPQIKALLLGVGARHIRDGLTTTSWQPYYDRLNDLGASGVKSTLTADRWQTASEIRNVAAHVPKSVEAFEGPNEQELNYASDPLWVPKARAFQKLLYTTVHGNSQTANMPVLAPAFSRMQAEVAVGNLSAYVDRGNYHKYWSGRNPGIAGYGGTHPPCGVYGSISFEIICARIVAGSKPMQVTETGYNTGAGMFGNVPEDVQAKYTPRLLLEQYLLGVRRAFVFELVDNTTTQASVNSFQFGLVTAGLRQKPAYAALANLTAMLSDRGSSFATTPLRYTLAGNGSNVHHVLLQKRDGSYYLVMWIEAAGWLPANSSSGGGRYLSVAPQNVSLSLPRAAHGFTLTTWNRSGGTSSTALRPGSSAAFAVTDSISVLHIKP